MVGDWVCGEVEDRDVGGGGEGEEGGWRMREKYEGGREIGKG